MKNLTVKQIIQLSLLVIILIFVMQNLGMVGVRFLFFKFELPLFILIAIMFIAGFYTSRLISSFRDAGKDRKNPVSTQDLPKETKA
jgi:uncharacterized integral membrane protein